MTTESLSHALRYLLANPDFWTADRLAQSAGVSKQTAYRALAATEAMGSDHCVRINKRVFACLCCGGTGRHPAGCGAAAWCQACDATGAIQPQDASDG